MPPRILSKGRSEDGAFLVLLRFGLLAGAAREFVSRLDGPFFVAVLFLSSASLFSFFLATGGFVVRSREVACRFFGGVRPEAWREEGLEDADRARLLGV